MEKNLLNLAVCWCFYPFHAHSIVVILAVCQGRYLARAVVQLLLHCGSAHIASKKSKPCMKQELYRGLSTHFIKHHDQQHLAVYRSFSTRSLPPHSPSFPLAPFFLDAPHQRSNSYLPTQ